MLPYKNKINQESRGGFNKIFTESEEKEIFMFLKRNFIDKNKMLCNEIIKIYVKSKQVELHPNKKFNTSDDWCVDFKKRWKSSTVKCSISKIATEIYTETELKLFFKEWDDNLNKVGFDLFINLDETKWNNINVSNRTIHIKGNDNAKINVNGNDKEGFTATLIITASGKKLKPIITAKGKTTRCLKSYELNNEVKGTFSNNGWANNGITKIAMNIIIEHTKGKNSCLLLDQFSSHRSEYIQEYAKSKNIHLLYIPVGSTYKYQPPDLAINGILKQKAKSSWRKEIIDNPNIIIKNKHAVIHFLKAYNELTVDATKKAFINAHNKI